MDELPGRFEEVRSSGGTLIVPFLALYQKRFYGNGNSTEVAAVFNGGDTIRFRISFGF